MKRSCIFLFLLLCSLLLISACGEPAPQIDEATGAYIYPTYPGDENWEAFWKEISEVASEEAPPLSLARQRMNIPEEILQEMSTEALVMTVRDYPLMTYAMDINTPGEPKLMFESLRDFNAVQELFQREDALETMEAQLALLKEEKVEGSAFIHLQKLAYMEGIIEELRDEGIGYSITEPYDFSVVTEQPGWGHGSNEEKLAKCNLPEELLPEMSTEALIETIFNHPLIVVYCDINNMPVNGNYNVHMDYLIETFNAVPELFSRGDALTVMEDVYYLGRTERRTFSNSVGYALLLELQARAEEAEPAYSLQAIPFSLAQGLSQEQHLNILDTDGERLLYRLHEYIRDGGIHPPNNQKLGLYSLSQDEILLELEFPDAQTLQGGILLPEGFAYCQTTADSGEQEEIEYQIFRADGAGEAQLIDSGFYENGIGLPPSFARLDSGDALYSYQQRRDGSSYFGLRRLDGAGQLHSLLELEKTEHSSPIYSEISTNGREYLYFLQEEEEGLFYLGDAEHVISTASLQPGEKLLSCTLLEDGGIFLLYPEEGAQKELSYRNLQGQPTSEERDLNRLFYLNRMCSNGKDRILAVGDRFEIYNVWIGDGLIQKEKLDQSRFPAELLEQPLRFFHLSESSYLLHYQQEDLLYLLTFPQ